MMYLSGYIERDASYVVHYRVNNLVRNSSASFVTQGKSLIYLPYTLVVCGSHTLTCVKLEHLQ